MYIWDIYIYKQQKKVHANDNRQISIGFLAQTEMHDTKQKLITFGKPWLVDEPNNNLKLWHHILLGFFIILFICFYILFLFVFVLCLFIFILYLFYLFYLCKFLRICVYNKTSWICCVCIYYIIVNTLLLIAY